MRQQHNLNPTKLNVYLSEVTHAKVKNQVVSSRDRSSVSSLHRVTRFFKHSIQNITMELCINPLIILSYFKCTI